MSYGLYCCPITFDYGIMDYTVSTQDFRAIVRFSLIRRYRKAKRRKRPSLREYNDHILHSCPDEDGEWGCSCMCSCFWEEKLPIFGSNGLRM